MDNIKLGELIYDLPSDAYHGAKGSYSSSQLKAMVEDPEIFYKKYITGEIERESIAAFDTGTYYHTAMLEPEKLATECVVYEGGVRRGKEWEAFRDANLGKAILTLSQFEEAQTLIEATRKSPIAMAYLNAGRPEISAFLEVFIFNREIYTIKHSKVFILTISGWACNDEISEEELKEFATRLVIKARADILDIESGTISDLKSTYGNPKVSGQISSKIFRDYAYDLSAAYYLDIFTMCQEEVEFNDFVWIFASKDTGTCKSYKASDRTIMVGRSKWKNAIVNLAYYLENNWKFNDILGEIKPPQWENEWIENF